MSTLRTSITAGGAGPVLVLAGEADVTNVEQLRDVIGAQLARGASSLTIDVAGLSFADSRAIGILAGTGRTLKELGGGLVLLRPQQSVLRTLTLLGVDQVITIQAATDMALKRNGEGGHARELARAAWPDARVRPVGGMGHHAYRHLDRAGEIATRSLLARVHHLSRAGTPPLPGWNAGRVATQATSNGPARYFTVQTPTPPSAGIPRARTHHRATRPAPS